mgnify:CR=1 FL=1
MIYSLKHDAESDAFVFASQRQGVSVFGNIAIADKCFITAIDKSVSVHITVFQVAYLYIAESRNRKIGIQEAKAKGYDLVIVDTAGRLAVDEQMMNEITAIKEAINPDEILFVVDSMTGQDAVNTAKEFNERLDFNGVVLDRKSVV